MEIEAAVQVAHRRLCQVTAWAAIHGKPRTKMPITTLNASAATQTPPRYRGKCRASPASRFAGQQGVIDYHQGEG